MLRWFMRIVSAEEHEKTDFVASTKRLVNTA